jgi:16S rRNA (guanine966-N2)-methyltransferase
MRVISGAARGRKLAAPKGLSTRPTPERVREALFSILAPRLAGARFLDLFSGTGAIGIEALSRGAASAVFVESDRRAAEVLAKNLAIVGGGRLVGQPVERALAGLDGQSFDIVFMDPPYRAGLLDGTLAALAERSLCAPGGVVICEHFKKTAAPEAPDGLRFVETRYWGDTALSFYEVGEA